MISLVRSASFVFLAAVAAGCSNDTPAGPGNPIVDRITNGRAAGPSGLEQRVVTVVERAPVGTKYTAMLKATSIIVNTGSAPVRLTSRMCLFLESDVETTAQMDRFEPLISCGAVSAEADLAPGASTAPLEAEFGVRSGPGTYALRLRHALSPDFRATATFVVPR